MSTLRVVLNFYALTDSRSVWESRLGYRVRADYKNPRAAFGSSWAGNIIVFGLSGTELLSRSQQSSQCVSRVLASGKGFILPALLETRDGSKLEVSKFVEQVPVLVNELMGDRRLLVSDVLSWLVVLEVMIMTQNTLVELDKIAVEDSELVE